jgi:Holliday junction resolvase
MGYATISEQNKIRKFVESKGSKGNPDLIALKGNEVLLVEIIEHIKGSATFVDQLQRYSKIGKGIVLLPINTKNINIWREQDVMT